MRTLALTIGEINGIGPEVTLKALQRVTLPPNVRLAIIAPPTVMQDWQQRLHLDNDLAIFSSLAAASGSVFILDPGLPAPEVTPGMWSAASGTLAGQVLRYAGELGRRGEVQAIVTAPLSKEALFAGGFHYPGQTEMIAEQLGVTKFAMILMSGGFRVALVTTHLPLRQVPAALTTPLILHKLQVVANELRQRFGIAQPRLAVTGLNPHAGEGGLLGDEEARFIAPAVAAAQERGLAAFGPFPADALFGRRARRRATGERDYDAYLAMYHDQGLIPLKAAAFGQAVNYTAGLPVVRTSPDHGTAFDIAGQGTADPSSMVEALNVAMAVITRHA